MCGVAGFIGKVKNPEIKLKSMISQVNHRGPDHNDTWISKSNLVGLGHARLSIIDLSKNGNQPFLSSCNRFVIVFNGEIYNHLQLRKVMKSKYNIDWRGQSDTETLIELISHEGIHAALNLIEGMFAFAVWDTVKEELLIVRDRFGEKPLYWTLSDEVFAFGSELRVLNNTGFGSKEISKKATSLYMRNGAIPAPYSIYKDIRKLQPGHLLSIDLKCMNVSISPYWDAKSAYLGASKNLFLGSYSDAIASLNNLLSEKIVDQMLSDVPLGSFLSGGIDSTLVTALMCESVNQAVETFSIGFEDPRFDEAVYAKQVAKFLGTKHTEVYVNEQLALEVVPNLMNIFDEPFADSSQIPTYLVSKIAKQNVTVALSGDGGDELFGGYTRYTLSNRIWRYLSPLPLPIRRSLAKVARQIRPDTFEFLLGYLFRNKVDHIGEKVVKGAGMLEAADFNDLYSRLTNISLGSGSMLLSEDFKHELKEIHSLNDIEDLSQRMMLADVINYLPTDILTKVDRSAMAVSLETRALFLNHQIFDFAAALPLEFKIQGGTGKMILRDLLYTKVPRELLERPKKGFAVPLASWLRGPLREWSESLLSVQSLQNTGIFSVPLVRKRWQEHLNGQFNWHNPLWNVLMLQDWMQKNH